MKQIEISKVNWLSSLADAVKEAEGETTTIVVHSAAQRELALRAAQKMGKTISVEVKVKQ